MVSTVRSVKEGTTRIRRAPQSIVDVASQRTESRMIFVDRLLFSVSLYLDYPFAAWCGIKYLYWRMIFRIESFYCLLSRR
jgi:hypothetical protein